MKWKNVNSELLATSVDKLFINWSSIDIVKFIIHAQSQPIVIINSSVKRRIMDHLYKKKTELGGLLLGNVLCTNSLKEGLIAIEITDMVASLDCISTSVSLTMSSDIWNKAAQVCDKKKFVVGWYHSHPNLGAFFSGTDRRTQKNFFNQEYSLGLVIDTIRNEEKIFIGSNSEALNTSHIIYKEDDSKFCT